MRLLGKVIFITAAAHGINGKLMGIGGATARVLAKQGAKLIVTDINADAGRQTCAEIRREGGDATFETLDVSNKQDWINTIEKVMTRFGKLDVLVNCAGARGGQPHSLEDTPVEEWDRQMKDHAKAVFLGTKYVIPHMRKIGGGSIINISSIYGIVAPPTSPAYSAAKGAIRIFTKAAAIQYAADNIRINSVHPGYVHTTQTNKMMLDPEVRQWLLDRTPLGRLANGEDIAHGIVYLASDESSFVTGSELIIDGGVKAQ